MFSSIGVRLYADTNSKGNGEAQHADHHHFLSQLTIRQHGITVLSSRFPYTPRFRPQCVGVTATMHPQSIAG
eukprot:scaffold6754_cov148-Amphora_coffeaeformis.AAC.8